MHRLKVYDAREGLHPSERILRIRTEAGMEELIVHPRAIDGEGTILVGYPVGWTASAWLVELPAETARGAWRAYVLPEELVPEPVLLPHPAASAA